jgi:hypothetical protein
MNENMFFLEQIPFEAYATGANGFLDKNLPRIKGAAQFLDFSGRIVVVANINGFKLPFYLSTGYGGKTNVPAGKWYPFFGISQDGYLNKGSSKDIVKFYDSPILKQIADTLDKRYGDIRKIGNIQKVGFKSSYPRDFINVNMGELADDAEVDGAYEKVYKNIEKVKSFLSTLVENTESAAISKPELQNNDIFYDRTKGIVIFKPKGDQMEAYKSLLSYFGKGRLELSNEQQDGKRLFYVKPTVDELKALTAQYNLQNTAQPIVPHTYRDME